MTNSAGAKVDPFRISAEIAHRLAHGRQVHHRAGTPVKSCMITRAGVNWISSEGSAAASHSASVRIWSAVTFAHRPRCRVLQQHLG